MGFARTIDNGIEPLRKLANKVGSPLFDLAARLYLGYEFFKAGATRRADFQSGNFENQINLFEFEHPVPGLSAEVAAYTTMGAETILPVMLFVGLFSRFSAAGLLIMTAVIEFTYGHFDSHILWAFLAAMIFIKGPGALSADHLLLKFIRK